VAHYAQPNIKLTLVQELANLLQALRQRSHRQIIVAGDFNRSPSEILELSRSLNLNCPELPIPITRRQQRLDSLNESSTDYILSSAQVSNAETLDPNPTLGLDHLYLVAEVIVPVIN
jgi:exonuclease III